MSDLVIVFIGALVSVGQAVLWFNIGKSKGYLKGYREGGEFAVKEIAPEQARKFMDTHGDTLAVGKFFRDLMRDVGFKSKLMPEDAQYVSTVVVKAPGSDRPIKLTLEAVTDMPESDTMH